MPDRDYAKRLAKHYFRLIAERAGVPWDHDNDCEIDAMIEAIITAAQEAGRDRTGGQT